MNGFIGRDVSIRLKRDLGIFQGKIVKVEPESMTITNAFYNGNRMKKFTAEVAIGKNEIENIEFVTIQDPAQVSRSIQNTPSASLAQSGTSYKSTLTADVEKSPDNFTSNAPFAKPFKPVQKYNSQTGGPRDTKIQKYETTTKPIPIIAKPSISKNFISASAPQSLKPDNTQSQNVKRNNKRKQKNVDLMQPDEFSDQDFDFEGNLALFDKKSVFKEIEIENSSFGGKEQKPDLVRQLHKPEEKYRHDENVLDSMMMQFRNVQLEFKPKQEYFTDEPHIIIPSIPQSLRNRIQNLAADHGLSMERQNDFLARGATELALSLLGGSRRLSPKNVHQWPRVTIICDEPYNFRQSEVGLSTARQLATHGLKVMVYVKTTSHSERTSKELELYTASGNDFTYSVKDLGPSDLVIMSVSSMNQNSQIIRYIQENRSPIMAIDPPATGISELNIRSACFPILPLDDINNTCGKLHLVNICIPEKFMKDAGIKWQPFFGSKFIIPLHLKN